MTKKPGEVSAADLELWLCDGRELALLDVREPGQIGEGHILFSAPAPYSRFEVLLPRRAPNPSVRMVLCDDADGVARRAGLRAKAMGYRNVYVLAGGVESWAARGRTLFKGVNVPSKAFGELVEHAYDTPRLSADEVSQRRAADEPMVMVDGRPAEEYQRMTIPGAQSCPNGELALRIGSLARDPTVPVLVNCAGRTRSIIGAQTLRELGIPNPVFALENGTQGWSLAGFDLMIGAEPSLADPEAELSERTKLARAWAGECGAEEVTADGLIEWLAEPERTTFLLDVRTAAERGADTEEVHAARVDAGVQHAPGGQLVQATDQWIGVRNARIVVMDSGDLRAFVVAAWLVRLGHKVSVLQGGVPALTGVGLEARADHLTLPDLPLLAPNEVERVQTQGAVVLDLRPSAEYRELHVAGARWSTRARIAGQEFPDTVVLVSSDVETAKLASVDLTEAGVSQIAMLDGGIGQWQRAGLPVEASPESPSDAERIDFLFFVHDRHDGNPDASRAYLAWETGLIAQLDPRERAVFQI